MTDKLTQDFFELETLFYEEEKKGNILRKNSKISEQARQQGNEIFTKKKHDQNDHKNILLQYTKSIAFAPSDSEELAFGFSNRSALLMHLCFYENCMIDINRALEITKSDKLILKLESRKEKCIKLINEQNKTRKIDEKIKDLKLDEDNLDISMIPSRKIQSAAESVTLKYNEIYGRHFIANRDIKPGEIIIAEKGYACYPKFHQIHLVCSHCLSSAWNGIPCNFCVFAVFCSEECKQAAWQEYHSIECPLLKFLHFDKNIYTVDVILSTRMFIKAVKAEGFDNIMNEVQLVHHSDGISRLLHNNVLDSNKFRPCYNQQGGSPVFNVDNYPYLYEIIIIYLLIKKTNIIGIEKKEHNAYDSSDKEIIMQLKNMFIKLRDTIDMAAFSYQYQRCNCTDIGKCQRECYFLRGVLVAPCSSLLNHSCMPNVDRFFAQKRKVVFYASRPIKKGEQLCCSYGASVMLDYVQRQSLILKNFHFTCRCTACNDKKTIIRGHDKDTFGKLLLTLVTEFKKKYKDRGMMSPFIAQDPKYWTVYNKELLEQALSVFEIIYGHFEKYTAYNFCIQFMIYTHTAFCELYGEKFIMPDEC